MKMPSACFTVAAIFPLFLQTSCSPTPNDAPQDSYRSVHWPSLMKGYSDFDNGLGSFVVDPNASSLPFTHFHTLLRDNNLSQGVIDKMTDLLQKTDTNLDRPAYHGFVHSARVGNVTASVMSSGHASGLSESQRILFTIAALFHDVDPERAKGTPPKVSSTFQWMDSNKEMNVLFAALKAEKNITKEQIKAVIKYTDFDTDPQKLAAIRADAEKMTDASFDSATAPIIKTWGPRIAYIDQVAMYIGSFDFAVQAVVGLANEFRAITTHLAEQKGTLKDEITKPTDIEILSNTSKFLAPRLNDQTFHFLPRTMQDNFNFVHRSFETTWAGKTSLN